MKRRWLFPCAVCLALLLGACTAAQPTGESQALNLYFLASQKDGPAIVGQACPDVEANPEALLHALLDGPKEETLHSPFPAGLTLRSCTLEDTHLTVDFSEQYGGLTDISLTLADYCVVLTVCQLEGIESVEITASGRTLPYRSHQILTLEDAVLAAQ